jgi:hypothetical protein
MLAGLTFDKFVREVFRFVNTPYGWVFLILFMIISIIIVRGPNRIKA